SDSLAASLKTTLTFGCRAAACRMSSFICTRHGSPRLHWLMPITYGSSGVPACFFGAELLQAQSGAAARARSTGAREGRVMAWRCCRKKQARREAPGQQGQPGVNPALADP